MKDLSPFRRMSIREWIGIEIGKEERADVWRRGWVGEYLDKCEIVEQFYFNDEEEGV